MNHAADLAKAEQHVRDSERHVERQKGIVAERRHAGHDVVQAEQLLATFEVALAAHRQHLESIRHKMIEKEKSHRI